MNVLFLLKNLDVGGVEVVSAVLANKFVLMGHRVFIFALEQTDLLIKDRLNKEVNVIFGSGFNADKQNVLLLKKIFVENDINIVVNQWGLPFVPIRLIRKAGQELKVKVISFHHNDPTANGKIKSVENELAGCRNPLKKCFLLIKKVLFKKITSQSMKYTYKHSDMFMVLSEAYLPLLRNFIHVGNSNKQGVLVNPITIDVKDYSYCRQEKQKEIVFCGRVDFNQKRVHRLIEVWSFLETKFPDWQLTIVGDGDAKKDLENQVNLMKLKSVRFEGFRKPLKYYRRASILALTSEYEGFPLVLAECMSFGVVPCVYDSFAAVHDIIEDDVNGLIIEKENGYFSAEKMAMRLAEIMSDEQKLDMMAQKSIETSKRYSIDSVYEQWMENLTQLTKKDQTTKVEYY